MIQVTPSPGITDTCACGTVYTRTNNRKLYCSRACQKKHSEHSSRTRKRKTNDLEFIGVDGEGVNVLLPDGTKVHRYVMLSVGDDTLFKDNRELSSREIFQFLYEKFEENPRAVFVGFFLGYDFTLWLKGLPEEKARRLFTKPGIASRKRQGQGGNPMPWPVQWGGWEFDILGMKRFMLRPQAGVDEKPKPWLYVCDTGAFFQTSFLNVIEPTEKKWPNGTAPCTAEEYAAIMDGKSNRAHEYAEHDSSYVPEMARYNRLENEILSRTMRTLNVGFVSAGVKLDRRSFYGPGQAIQYWLDTQVKEHSLFLSHADVADVLPEWVLEASWSAYYGGRFEQFYHGHIPGESFEYDITSAYPHAMRALPCLCTNTWTRGTDIGTIPEDKADVVFVRAHVAASNQFVGPLPFRNPNGNILYPNETVGWYLLSELVAGMNAGLVGAVVISEWVAHLPCGHPSPLAGVADLYEMRKKVGKTTPQGKALKLMFNSAYGKFAQSIGNPKYGNPVYASMITSHCRSIVLEAIGHHPNGINDLLMVATDAVYFRTKHPDLDTIDNADELGGWEPAVKNNLTLMKPGVYWDDKGRQVGAVAVKSRGISAKALSEKIAQLDTAFSRVAETINSEDLPRLIIPVPFSITSPALALARNKWPTCGDVQWDADREDWCRLEPKRHKLHLHDGLLRSEMMRVPPGQETMPYDKRFGFGETRIFENEEQNITPDAGTGTDFQFAIRSVQ